jgi:beta-N-acetylhexosaminidase
MKMRITILSAMVIITAMLTSCLPNVPSSDQDPGVTSEVHITDHTDSNTTTANTNVSDSTEQSTALPTEPVSSEEMRAADILMNMTLEEKVGQMFFVRCPEVESVSDVSVWHLGGYILFARDFEDKTELQVIDQINMYQNEAAIPLLIGVDEEGGTVVRVSKFSVFREERFPSPQALYAEGGWDMIRSDAAEKSDLLLALGINVNLAPVCDVSTNSGDFIYERSIGLSAEDTSVYAATVVGEMVQHQIGCVLKHFPGYGNNVDTHTGIAFDNRSYDSFVTGDFLPFAAGIRAGAGSILVAHNIVSSMDAYLPASLSPEVHRILRDELGFAGVIMTDDLYMDAIKDYTGGKEAAVLAVLAGNDMIISTDYDIQIPAVLEAVQNGSIPETMIDESVMRILLWKISLGIIA